MKLWFFIWATALLCTKTLHAQNTQKSVLKRVIIDAGHGGRDSGALGAKTKEKDIVLDIALRLGKMIDEKYPDIEVLYTRKTDVFIELDRRSEIANKAHADLFISIHANSVSGKNKSPAGTETFVMGSSREAAHMEVAKRENSVILFEDDYSARYEGYDPNRAESHILFQLLQNSYQNQSLLFAAEVQSQFKNSAKRYNRGVKQAGFLVLWKTAMPSILIEVGFISNPDEEKFISSSAGKTKLATAIFQAFCTYKTATDDSSTAYHPADSHTDTPRRETAESVRDSSRQVPAPAVEFCIQIGVSSTPMEPAPHNFKKYRDVERIQSSKQLYKYITGRSPNYAAAQQILKKVSADFGDAFIVCIVDGKIIPAAEGIKLMQP